jgi:hypothetical protein
MKQKLLLGLVVVAIAALVFWMRTRPPKGRQQEFKSTDELIQFEADVAVKDAEKEDHVKLDYGVDSIKQADEILGRLHNQYVKDQSSVQVSVLASAYGAYIGEVIRRNEPDVKWQRNDSVGGEASYPLRWAGSSAFPMAWCYKRITEGEEDNVWSKYEVFKQLIAKEAAKRKD